MSIKDLIVPRWKHSNPQVRIQSIRSLESANKSEILKHILENDAVPEVRIEAIQLLEDTTLLKQVIQTDNNQDVQKTAVNKLNRCYAKQVHHITDQALQEELIDAINDEKILAQIACGAERPEIRLMAIDRITNPLLLCQITEHNCGLKPGKAIVDKISDPKHLEMISKHANNKKIKKYAKEKLANLWENPDALSPEKRNQWELEELCLELEKVVASEQWSESYSVLKYVQTKWTEFDPDETHPLRKRFNQFRNKIEEQVDQLDRKEDTVLQMTDLCKELEQLTEELDKSSIPSNSSKFLSYYEKKIIEIKEKWDQAELNVEDGIIPFSVYHNFSSRYNRSIEQMDRLILDRTKAYANYQVSLKDLCDICEQLEEIKDKQDIQNQTDTIESLKLKWSETIKEMSCVLPTDISLRYKTVVEYFSEQQKSEENEIIAHKVNEENRLQQLCETVEQAKDAEIRAGLEKVVKSAQKEWQSLGEKAPDKKVELSDRFELACKEFYTFQRDFWEKRNWEQWANLALKEELCDALEQSLKNDTVQTMAELARRAQEKWRELGSVERNKSESIWARFHQICDKIYTHCYAQKEIIHNELKAIIASLNNDISWKETTETIKAIQERWNAIGPLPKAVEKDLRQSFQDMCNHFFEQQRDFYTKKDQERKQNLNAKMDLCEQAEKLANSDDWTETSRKLKSLQRKWKQIGPVPRNESDALWKRFRTACNTFFQRLENELPKNLEKKQALCEMVERIVVQLDQTEKFDQFTEKILDLQQQWKQIGPVPQEQSQAIWERFQAPCNTFFEKKSVYIKQRKQQWDDNQKIKEKLVEEAELLASSTDWKETSARLSELQKQWQQTGSTTRKVERELWSRFQEANDYFFSNQVKHFESLDTEKKEKLKQKESLCLSLEILAKLTTSTTANFEYNKFIPIAEQLDMALKFKDEIFVPNDSAITRSNAMKKMKDIQSIWESIGYISDRYDKSLARRYRKAIDYLSSVTSK
jgi:hypothetical protein